MVSYHRDNIKLQEAMTMELKQKIRVWETPGLHVEVKEMPKNATVKKTFMMKHPDGHGRVGVEWTVKGDSATYMDIVFKFSAWEELKDKFPKLFELKGNLIAFF